MWIISIDREFYPRILKFRSKEKAKESYYGLKNDLEIEITSGYRRDEAIFLSEVSDSSYGNEYDFDYEDNEK